MSENWGTGPWFMDFDLCDEEGQLDEPEFNGRILDKDNMIVCEAVKDINAHLVAAAPEMYAALDCLLAIVGLTAFKHESQRAVLQEAVDEAISALKKARGES